MKVTLLRPPAAGSFAPRWGRRGSAGTVTRARGGRASRDVLAPKKKNQRGAAVRAAQAEPFLRRQPSAVRPAVPSPHTPWMCQNDLSA